MKFWCGYFRAREIQQWPVSAGLPTERGKYYVPARPVYIWYFFERLVLAWRVFTGRYDALDWEDKP